MNVANNKFWKKLIAFLMVAVFVANTVFSVWTPGTVEAAEDTITVQMDVESKWKAKKTELGWFDSGAAGSEKPSTAYWDSTKNISTYWINVADEITDYPGTGTASFASVATATDADIEYSDVDITQNTGTADNSAATTQSLDTADNNAITTQSTDASVYGDEASQDSAQLAADTDGVTVYKNTPSDNSDSLGYCIIPDSGEEFDVNAEGVTDEDKSKSVDYCKYNAYKETEKDKADTLYYSVRYSESLEGYYREYYVSTADQLSQLFYKYGDSKRVGALKTTPEELKMLGYKEDVTSDDCVDKVGIVLLSDLDLGGSSDITWSGYKNQSFCLELDGNGHTIYNGYYSTGYFLEAGDYYLAIENLTFRKQYIRHEQGMFGNSVQWAYFNNVNWEDCVAVKQKSGVTIVLGNSYRFCYFKECTIKNSYIFADGEGHNGMFASYNSTTGISGYATKYYLDDKFTELSGYYHISVPDESETERAWKEKLCSEYSSKTLNKQYPSIYEDCGTVNCDVFQLGDSEHSGIFVSCVTGNIIFRNCYANGTIYGDKQLGVFTGACIGVVSGFNYPDPDNGSKSKIVNTVFENCYASGTIEGYERLGGFVGMIYNDARANFDDLLDPPVDTSNDKTVTKEGKYKFNYSKGIVVFKNCYSTSAVGMEYTGIYAGGFVGIIRGNTLGSDKKHRFINCYAAGEVGGITIDTGTGADNTNTVGGFVGVYVPEDYKSNPTTDATTGESIYPVTDGIMTNCYYDKQTTSMRERDIGSYTTYTKESTTSNGVVSNVYSKPSTNGSLVSTLPGLTGVYTKSSKLKGVAGLTDTVDMNDADNWTYETDYYPQLSCFAEKPAALADDATAVEKMKYERKLQYYYDSLASTATVFLDHYDDILTEDGTERKAEKTEADRKVYDTVTDITSKFEFTTDDGNNITWTTDNEKNTSSGFVSKIGSGDDTGFTIDYGDVLSTAITDSSGGSTTNLSVEFDPSVLTIRKVDDVYKCLDFAPGKQWVQVKSGGADATGTGTEDDSGGTGDTNAGTEEENITGSRYLRLLPTAYLNAGNIMTINITKNEDGTSKNTVSYTLSDNTEVQLSGTFNHSIGVAYAITDKYRMGDSTIYGSQTRTRYNSLTGSASGSGGSSNASGTATVVTDDTSFVFYGEYNENDQRNNYLIGVNSAENTDSNSITTMLSQKFQVSGTSDKAQTNKNLSYENGLTRVRIFKAKLNEKTKKLEKQSEIDYTADNIAKWQGEKEFEFNADVDDTGYYYLDYYWRFTDGRYLTDSKLVRITSNSYNVEMITGILGEEHTANSTKTPKTAIDQYVTDEISAAADSNNSIKWDTEFPSDDTNFAKTEATAASTYYYDYNAELTYNNDLYYTKTKRINTNTTRTVVGWRRNTDYMLTTIIVEAIKQDGTKYQMARIDKINSSNPSYSFDTAAYKYDFVTYSVTQDPDTKLFTIKENSEVPIVFSIQSSKDSLQEESAEKYIVFDFTSGITDTNGQQTTYTQITDSLRVTALFRNNTANVEGEKYVLLSGDAEDSVSSFTGTNYEEKKADDGTVSYVASDYTYYNSLDEAQADMQVDNNLLTSSEINDLKERKAVLSGDTLTYRVKLTNAGFFESDVVHVYDTIPKNTTYVPGSMKIYRQQINQDKEDEYGALEKVAWQEVTNGASSNQYATYVYSGDYLADMSPPTSTSDSLSFTIPSIALNYCYYVQYQVTVDDLPADTTARTLENTAYWDFLCRNGDLKTDFTAENLATLKANEVFTLSMDVDEKDTTAGTENRTYKIDFFQKDKGDNYEDVTFTNNFPDGFTLDEDYGIKLFKYETVTDSETGEVTKTYNEKANLIKSVIDGEAGEETSTADSSEITLVKKNGSFTISGFDISDKDAEYVVVFKGTQVKLGDEYTDSSGTKSTLTEIRNKASILYMQNKTGSDTSTGSSTNNSGTTTSTNSVSKANSIEKVERFTNTVETDVTHLYLKVEKNAYTDAYSDGADTAQTFLFRIDYYADQDAYSKGNVSDTIYTKINVDNSNAITTTDSEGTETTIGYSGDSTIQMDKRGIYVVSELSDWSATDYNQLTSTYTDVTFKTLDAEGIDYVNVYPEKATLSSSSITVGSDNSVQVALPRVAYTTGAIPTYFGMNIESAPTVTFNNTPSEYAYLSSQAYSDNTIK